jgi:predicted MPP superfamily phosphohydrolase
VPIFYRMKGAQGAWLDVVAWAGYLGFGFFTLLFAFLVVKDLLYVVALLIDKAVPFLAHLLDTKSAAGKSIDAGRRQVITNVLNLGVLGVTGALTGYGIYQARRTPRVVELTVPLSKLPPEFENFSIVQTTDIHASHTIKRGFVQRVVDRVNELEPDLVALTGDLVDGSVEQLRHDVAPLAELTAPHGLFFVTGNHDYYSGIQQWVVETRRLGFDVLLNEHRIIERGEGRLVLGGVTDISGGQFLPSHRTDPHKAIEGAPDNLPRVLLAHQPRSVFEAEKAGFDYMMCGHTHGGQYFPYHFLVAMAQPYIAGMHQHGRTRIYVSRGTGYWGPQLRIGSPSEITVHRLVSA